METIYNQLYQDYICPAMAQTEQEHKKIIDGFISTLSLEHDKQLAAYDLITYIRYQWGLEVFIKGVRMGIELSYAPDREPEDYQALLDFLSKFHQPVP